MIKKLKLLVFLFVMLSFIFQINAIKMRTGFIVKKVEPGKVQLVKDGKEVFIKISGRKLTEVEDVLVGSFRGKKFIKSGMITKIIKKKSSHNKLFVKMKAGENVTPGKKYILRLLGKKVNKDTPSLDVSTKLLKIIVVSDIKKKIVIMKTPVATYGKTLSSPKPPIRPLNITSYSLNKRNLEIKNDDRIGIIVVNGKDLEKVTSAQVILNNKVVKNIKVELGIKKGDSREIKFTALPGVKTVANYKLRLLYGNEKVDVPSSKFSMKISPSLEDSPEFIDLKPDLVIKKIRLEIVDKKTGSFECYATVQNIGKDKAFFAMGWSLFYANPSWDSAKWTGLNLKNDLMIPPLGSHECIVQKYNNIEQYTKGTHTIKVKVDPENKVNESNENNNIRSKSITLLSSSTSIKREGPPDPKKPDLIIKNIRFMIKDTSGGSPQVYGYAVIKNISNTEAFLSRGWDILKSKYRHFTEFITLEENFKLLPWSSCEYYIYYIPLSWALDYKSWTVEVDPKNKIAESNEFNNTKVQIPSFLNLLGDLIIKSIHIEPSVATIEGNFEVVITVENIGVKEIKGRTSECAFLTCLNFETINSKEDFAPGEIKIFRARPTMLSRGTFDWEVQVNPYQCFYETTKENNTKVFTITIN